MRLRRAFTHSDKWKRKHRDLENQRKIKLTLDCARAGAAPPPAVAASLELKAAPPSTKNSRRSADCTARNSRAVVLNPEATKDFVGT